MPKQNPLERLSGDPEVVYCLVCNHTGKTRVDFRRNTSQTLCCTLVGIVLCIPCLPCLIKTIKGTIHYCSNCGVRLAYKPEGFASITPSYVHDRDLFLACKGYTSHPKLGEEITSEKNVVRRIGSPLGDFDASNTHHVKQNFQEIKLIPPPIKEGTEAEGTWQVETSENRFQDYKITVDECPPWTDDTADATPRYHSKVADWKARSGPRDPEIRIERPGLASPLSTRIRRIAASNAKLTTWNFDISANGRSFDFAPLSMVSPTRQNVEWSSGSGPLFWQTPGWYTNELLDAYGRTCAVYRTTVLQRRLPMSVSVAEGISLEIVDEMLLVAIAMQVFRVKKDEWYFATRTDD